MYFVYVLRSRLDGSFYVGYTTDLKKRFERHNKREVLSTKNKEPWKLIFFEAFTNSKDAKNRELYLKSGWGRRSLGKIISNTLNKI